MSNNPEQTPEQTPEAESSKCVALNSQDAASYTPAEGHDTVVCLAFGIFDMDDFKEMGYGGSTPVFIVGSGMKQKPMLEPFFVMGESKDVKLTIQGFFSDVFKAYSNKEGQDEPDTATDK